MPLDHSTARFACFALSLFLTSGFLCSCSHPRSAARREGFEEGYIQGQSDSIKRHYFLRQELERRPLPREASEGRIVAYRIPAPDAEAGGSKNKKDKPATVTVRVVE